MKSTSFKGLAAHVDRIEIPMLQRDYAQGRADAETRRIRERFLHVLHGALTGNAPVGLDFVYGEVKDRTLVPLDGQQRLTTLYLLHWYLSARIEPAPSAVAATPTLSFETRESSRRFCETLVRQRPFSKSEPMVSVSAWLRDQPWFAGGWRHDPTIAGMLVVLDAIHNLFKDVDCAAALERLVDADRPAISFDFVPLSELGMSDDLYVKMNSRGRPLTSFELFKAEFGALLKASVPDRHDEVTRKLDGAWTDVLWRVRDTVHHVIDDRYLRYFRFVTHTMLHLANIRVGSDDLENATAAYGNGNAQARENLRFLEFAFDTWVSEDVPEWFGRHFTVGSFAAGKVALFEEVDLFRRCCEHFGDPNRFSLWNTILLFAVLVHRSRGTGDFASRVRVLRNLVLNSADEINEKRLPALLRETLLWIVDGHLDAATSSFRRVQAREEVSKHISAARPATLAEGIARLEDHPLLRGCVGAFDLDDPHFGVRASAFAEIFAGPAGLPAARLALLASGDYSQRNRAGRFVFGSDTAESWRELLTRSGHDDFHKIQGALRRLLDAVAVAPADPISDRLGAVAAAFLAARERECAFDWRYYLVKYDRFVEGKDRVFDAGGYPMGFTTCLLWATTMHGYTCDPVLLAMHGAVKHAKAGSELELSEPWRRGRWDGALRILASGVTITSGRTGFAVTAPTPVGFAAPFEIGRKTNGIGHDGVAAVSQRTIDGVDFDCEDRVAFGVRLLGDLLDMRPG